MSEEQKPSQDSETGLSRRGFLKGFGVSGATSGLLATAQAQEAEGEEDGTTVHGPGEIPVTLNINGKDHRVNVEPRVTLLDTLRNRLDLTGSKKVCDRGTCGACTVLLDGEPVYSCSMLAVEAEGRQITTIEGLGTPEQMNAIQEAFVEHDAQQCGFCTPGFVVACTATLHQNPDATLEEAQNGCGGNLCRCGTYAGINQALLDAAKAMKGGR